MALFPLQVSKAINGKTDFILKIISHFYQLIFSKVKKNNVTQNSDWR